ncbi:hypothetical protein GBAR_LOCUS1176 [Geodia barretti]|uniref:Uncharacterized protein n=1 Tax=Geodia barretti TaxID=519541 RepID=A0AA35QUW7_GEOBA|nr:hypothetical protein GBAR_LOCUS1176 [Geodia barretti]
MSDEEGKGLAVGALDVVLLLVAVAAVGLLLLRWRRRGKKESVRSVSVPSLSLGRPVENYGGVGGNFLSRMKSTVSSSCEKHVTPT